MSNKLQQLQEEVQQAMEEALENSKLGEICQRYGLTVDNLLKIQFTLDLTKLRSDDTSEYPQVAARDVAEDRQVLDSLQELPAQAIVLTECCWCTNPRRYCCSC